VTGEQAGLVARVAEPEHLARAAEQGVDLAAVDAVLTDVATSRPYAAPPRRCTTTWTALSRMARSPIRPRGGGWSSPARRQQRLRPLRPRRGRVGEAAAAGRPLCGDERTRSQQQADALVQLCDNALAAGSLPVLRGHKPQVLVTVGAEDLTDPATGPGAAETGFGATISAARARRLACDGNITRIVRGPDGMPLD
jgi:hypothetical protein